MNKARQRYTTPSSCIAIAISILLICLIFNCNILLNKSHIVLQQNAQLDKYIQKNQLFHNTIIVNKTSIRILQSQQNDKDNSKSQSSANNENKKFFITIVIIVIVFFVLGIICCAVCIIRYIFIKQRFYSKSAVANSKIGHSILFPSISYHLFLQFVGEPLHTHCVICLQDFGQKKKYACKNEMLECASKRKQVKNEQQMSHHSISASENIYPTDRARQKSLKLCQQQIKSEQYIESVRSMDCQNFLVKFTVCGHLFHSKCLQSWLLRLQCCPLCRQQFSFQNINLWQQKLNLKFDGESYDIYIKANKQIKQANHQQTLAEIGKSLSKNEMEINNIEQEHHKMKDTQQSRRIKYAIKIYSKIMSYHKKSSEENVVKKLLKDQCEQQLYFEQGQNQFKDAQIQYNMDVNNKHQPPQPNNNFIPPPARLSKSQRKKMEIFNYQ